MSKTHAQANIQKLENVMDVNGSLVEVLILETDGLPDPQISRGFKLRPQADYRYLLII